jgi:hypothetical protein
MLNSGLDVKEETKEKPSAKKENNKEEDSKENPENTKLEDEKANEGKVESRENDLKEEEEHKDAEISGHKLDHENVEEIDEINDLQNEDHKENDNAADAFPKIEESGEIQVIDILTFRPRNRSQKKFILKRTSKMMKFIFPKVG